MARDKSPPSSASVSRSCVQETLVNNPGGDRRGILNLWGISFPTQTLEIGQKAPPDATWRQQRANAALRPFLVITALLRTLPDRVNSR